MAVRSDQIVLVGLPGSGKSTVGPLIAQRLGWSFIDLDARIEAVLGMSVPRIFERRGEAEFRRIESELTGGLASVPEIVLSPGGGWLVGNQLPGALIVWLRVDPEIAVRRLGDGVSGRPLLQPDPLKRMQELLAQREQYYKQAELHIDTNGKTADEVAAAVIVAVTKQNVD